MPKKRRAVWEGVLLFLGDVKSEYYIIPAAATSNKSWLPFDIRLIWCVVDMMRWLLCDLKSCQRCDSPIREFAYSQFCGITIWRDNGAFDNEAIWRFGESEISRFADLNKWWFAQWLILYLENWFKDLRIRFAIWRFSWNKTTKGY